MIRPVRSPLQALRILAIYALRDLFDEAGVTKLYLRAQLRSTFHVVRRHTLSDGKVQYDG